jgi:Thoeris protein ThsB, TIR-like domain
MVLTSAVRRARGIRHRVFLSYYHYDDQSYRNAFERAFGSIFITKSVQQGDINVDNSDEYIKRLIQEDFINGASVVIVLVWPKTKCRKHVDWEVSAGLNIKVGGYSGLMGILLPTFPLTATGNYYRSNLPRRLDANVNSGYASLYRWDHITANVGDLTAAIDVAFDRRVTDTDKIVNRSIPQMRRNTCD